ncbi:hypothetical protein ISF_09281 [Cordyceps fumosorosea ARSEF 2679]|uniref:Uncharacterized protein n=1 Tax=Cordyceps fumosorosea (strain ARSEF 2679) TaxID=1081104 RepID=A0A167KS80_CORFA|nr:hypothetical protein ISF_09281 [Cordyceps fumosorosea ARSEF 2679]OAA52117.1 hypothetical protein ISF_09281 [Cordyceps fumosorosea ARSEF 2679]
MDPNNSSQRLMSVLSLNTGKEPATWGITVVRTDYKAPQQHLVDALACLNDAVRADLGASRAYPQRRDGFVLDRIAFDENWPPLAPRRPRKQQHKKNNEQQRLADELFARYSTELLSKRDKLNEADADTVRKTFQDWIVQQRGNPHGGDMRYVFCVVLDAEAIRQLHDLWRLRRRGCQEARARVRVLDAIPGGGAYSVGLRGAHGLVSFCFARRRSRHPLEVLLTGPPRGEEGMWCFGPWEAEALPPPPPPPSASACEEDGNEDGMPIKGKDKGKGKARKGKKGKGRGLKNGDKS